MGFVWDPAKADANRRKHGVDFADAIGALEDTLALTRPDPFPTESRFATIWNRDDEDIRLISARLATPRERRAYTEEPDA